MEQKDFIVILFYKFTDLADPEAVASSHKEKCKELGLLGRMLVAEEGINGTFEGTTEAVDAYIDFLHADPRFADVLVKKSQGTGTAFRRLQVKVRDEVVTLGAGRFNPKEQTATELPAAELQQWYKDGEDFIVLDLRNDYEIASGKFDKTIDPGLANFRDLPEKMEQLKVYKDKKVVTVCTGGIRCEKATCYLKEQGFSDIYQLKDGIHTYMEQYPDEHFKGTLFVFDNRMTTRVVPGLATEVIGRCTFCNNATETYYSDDSVRPSKKILCCDACYEIEGARLRAAVTVKEAVV